jgi:septum formation protein
MAATLILASQSPRRSELLATLGVPFTVDAADISEAQHEGERAAELAERLAAEKCRAVLARNPGCVVLAADTVVVLTDAGRERVLGKPADADEAAAMLLSLQGRTHEVFTGYCILDGRRSVNGVARTAVEFAPLDASEIRAYVATGEPMDKAGAYAIQGVGARFVPRISGSYTNVVGLPLTEVYEALKDFGFFPRPPRAS